jgi:hypothetical protein
MNEDIKAQAKKLRIPFKKYIHTTVMYTDRDIGVKDLIEKLNAFLKDNNLEDANFTVETSGSDSYFDGAAVSAQVDKSDEELKAEIEVMKQRQSQERKRYRETLKQREEREKKEYLRLKKKYDRS